VCTQVGPRPGTVGNKVPGSAGEERSRAQVPGQRRAVAV